MYKLILSYTIFLLFGINTKSIAQSRTYFVSLNGKGNGTSWINAFGDLQDALKKAKFGDQIWIAEGVYHPTTNTDRNISFNLKDGVTLLGGFIGNEILSDERDPLDHPTLLSGNIASDALEDNSYNVIYTKNVSDKTVVDGFIIIGGYAKEVGQSSDRKRSGGAWYNEGTFGTNSNPTIVNCIFIDNFAKDGGAIYNNGYRGNASPTFIDCTFENNNSDLDGGAIYNNGQMKGNSNPIFTSCKFIDNKGNYGGAIFNNGVGGICQPIFTNCEFSTNNAYVKGGAVFHMTNEKFVKNTMFEGTIFNNNNALDHNSDDIHQFLIKGIQKSL
jgi:predicted outer membrane repeat protein